MNEEINKERLSEEELDAKIAEAKERILANKIDTTKVVNNTYTGTYKYTTPEERAKKARNRRRNKVQKLSRKKNR